MQSNEISGVTIRCSEEEPKVIDMVDSVTNDTEYLTTTLEPYLSDLFTELANKSPNANSKILKIVFLDVCHYLNNSCD